MREEVLEMGLVVGDKFVDDRAMQVITGEFVRIAVVDYCSQIREVFGHGGRALLHDEVVLLLQFLEELRVVVYILKQWLEADMDFNFLFSPV